MIPSDQVTGAPPAQVPAMRPSPTAEAADPPAPGPPAPDPSVPARPVPVRPVPTARRGLPVALIYGVLCGVLGLLVAPVLLGPAAIVGGFAGEHVGRRGVRKAGAAAALVAVIGALVAVLVLH